VRLEKRAQFQSSNYSCGSGRWESDVFLGKEAQYLGKRAWNWGKKETVLEKKRGIRKREMLPGKRYAVL
jgi:hypothetical protein